jgi:FixJ family two-component response regulator
VLTKVPLVSVVEDDDGVRNSLDGLVRSLGYRVALFSNAEDFLAAPESSESCCVITDVNMGGMDGITLTRQLSASGGGKVIVISAFLDDRLQDRATEAGAHCFLAKPFSGDALVDCIEHAMAA